MVRSRRVSLKSLAALLISMGTGAAVLISVLVLLQYVELEFPTAVRIFGYVGICLLLQLFAMRMQPFGPSFVVVLYTIISHFGWPIVATLGSFESSLASMLTTRHLYQEYFAAASSVATLAMVSLFISWSYVQRRPIKVSGSAADRSAILLNIRESRFGDVYVSLSMIVTYAFAVLLGVFALGNGLISANYQTVKDAFAEAPGLAHLQRAFWVVFATLAALGTRRDILRATPAVLLIAITFMASGNRNDILYPLAAAFGLYVHRRKQVSKLALLGAAAIVFVVNPFVADARQQTMGGSALGLRVEDAVMELGAQIAPFTVVHSVMGHQVAFMGGLSLLLPTLAFLTFGLMVSPSSYLESSYFIPNVLAQQGHLGRGFSMIAEAWVNFGTVGTILFFAVVGGGLAWIENRAVSRTAVLLFPAVTVLMVYWARNSLQFNVSILVYALVAVFIAQVLSSIADGEATEAHGGVSRRGQYRRRSSESERSIMKGNSE